LALRQQLSELNLSIYLETVDEHLNPETPFRHILLLVNYGSGSFQSPDKEFRMSQKKNRFLQNLLDPGQWTIVNIFQLMAAIAAVVAVFYTSFTRIPLYTVAGIYILDIFPK